jgi:hypothetical protein
MPASLLVPKVEDGVEGVRFISGVLESSRQNSAWVKMPAPEQGEKTRPA